MHPECTCVVCLISQQQGVKEFAAGCRAIKVARSRMRSDRSGSRQTWVKIAVRHRVNQLGSIPQRSTQTFQQPKGERPLGFGSLFLEISLFKDKQPWASLKQSVRGQFIAYLTSANPPLIPNFAGIDVQALGSNRAARHLHTAEMRRSRGEFGSFQNNSLIWQTRGENSE